MRPGVSPPIAKTGVGSTIAASAASASSPAPECPGFDPVGKIGPTTTWETSLGERPTGLDRVVRGAPVERRRLRRGRRRRRRQVEADPERARERRVAVHDEARRRAAEPLQQALEQDGHLGLRQVTLADLDEPHAARDRRLDDVDQVAPAGPLPVRHEHEARERPPRRDGSGQRLGSRPAWIRPSHGLDASA